jgi:hypothetical protein
VVRTRQGRSVGDGLVETTVTFEKAALDRDTRDSDQEHRGQGEKHNRLAPLVSHRATSME